MDTDYGYGKKDRRNGRNYKSLHKLNLEAAAFTSAFDPKSGFAAKSKPEVDDTAFI
jgi:hypothetical protein